MLKYGDKLPDGTRHYLCPHCKREGYDIASTTVCVTYTAPLMEGGRIKLGRQKDETLTCLQCGNNVAILVKGKWQMIGLV